MSYAKLDAITQNTLSKTQNFEVAKTLAKKTTKKPKAKLTTNKSVKEKAKPVLKREKPKIEIGLNKMCKVLENRVYADFPLNQTLFPSKHKTLRKISPSKS